MAARGMSASRVIDALAGRELLIVSGKGGVGRTAMSALLGLELARRDHRVLVATVGQDDRLAWMLGQPTLPDTATEIAKGLFIQRVVPHVCVREYGSMMLKSERVAKAVFGNKLMRRLMSALPGLDDYAILGKLWHVACRAREYDTVVFDGPATGHLRYTLGVPRTILDSVPRGPLTSDARQMSDALQDPKRVQAVLVGLPARWPLTELGELAISLREDLHIGIGAIVVNGLWPSGLPVIDPAALPAAAAESPLGGFFSVTNTIAAQAARQQHNVHQWLRDARGSALRAADVPAMLLPWRWEGFAGLADIEAFARTLPNCPVRYPGSDDGLDNADYAGGSES